MFFGTHLGLGLELLVRQLLESEALEEVLCVCFWGRMLGLCKDERGRAKWKWGGPGIGTTGRLDVYTYIIHHTHIYIYVHIFKYTALKTTHAQTHTHIYNQKKTLDLLLQRLGLALVEQHETTSTHYSNVYFLKKN